MAPIPREPLAAPSPSPGWPEAEAAADSAGGARGGLSHGVNGVRDAAAALAADRRGHPLAFSLGRAWGAESALEPPAAAGLSPGLICGSGPGRAGEVGEPCGQAGMAGAGEAKGPPESPAERAAAAPALAVASLAAPAVVPGLKVIVFDDDPTGSQTVHSAPLLLRWDAPTLAAGLGHPSPLLFLLANTRALDPGEARRRVREICRALLPALAEARRSGVIDRWLVVSRGDSTLRGHFPLEAEVIGQELGPFEATFLVPAFLEGGRTTVAGMHLLHGEPVHHSAFARDSLFGYSTSRLADWAQEKSGGRIAAAAVGHISLAELEPAARPALRRRLEALAGNPLVVVDAERPEQLAGFGAVVRELLAGPQDPPRRFLFQSAASLLNGLVPLPAQPRDARGLAALCRRLPDGGRRPGLVLVGSHVPLADDQLTALLAEPGCGGVEVPVARVHRLLEGPLPDRLLASLEREWLERLRGHLAAGRTPVLFTSRGELRCRHAAERRRLGQALAAAMARVAAQLAPQLGYLISKGGITSHTLLAEGLGLDWVDLQGQLQPGLSLVLVPPAGSGGAVGTRVGGIEALPLVTVPGNLGAADTLLRLWHSLEGRG